MRSWLLLWLALLLAFPAVASAQQPRTAQPPVLLVYVRDGCPHCAEAKAFLPGFAAERPWLQIEYRAVDQDPAAREELSRISQAAGLWPPGVPTFVFGDRVLPGFDVPERSGPLLDALVAGAAPAPADISTSWFGTLSVERLGLPLFTLAIGLLDGFNPCAMWVLLFLLSMLVHLRDRRRMALIAGTFVLVSGVVYYAFMAAWLNLFLTVGLSDALRIGLALLALAIAAVHIKDFVRPQQGFSLSIPAAAKPGIYARTRRILQADTLWLSLLGVAALALAVNLVELLCTAGLPAMYTAILTQQDLSAGAHYAYLGLYILGYLFDDALMVATAVFALSSRKLGVDSGRWLKLISGVVMLALGATMLLRPQWLL
jgi:glutaredoxin